MAMSRKRTLYSLDRIIAAMYETGKDMSAKYRGETYHVVRWGRNSAAQERVTA